MVGTQMNLSHMRLSDSGEILIWLFRCCHAGDQETFVNPCELLRSLVYISEGLIYISPTSELLAETFASIISHKAELCLT
nr:hypothetical protein CFP56_65789 [Quercus suber]